MRSIGPAVTREQSPAFLRNSNGRLDLPTLNGKQAKPSTEVKVGDVMEIRFGEKMAKYRILAVAETVRKADAGAMYELIEGDDDL